MRILADIDIDVDSTLVASESEYKLLEKSGQVDPDIYYIITKDKKDRKEDK